jgi:hypothetical protein
MKMSPSVMAASDTWLAIAQETIEPVNQWAAPYDVPNHRGARPGANRSTR